MHCIRYISILIYVLLVTSFYDCSLLHSSQIDFHTFGLLNSPIIQNNKIVFSGTAISEDRDPIDGYRIQFLGKNEIAHIHPYQNKSFMFELYLANPNRLDNQLITLYPRSGGKEGSPLHQINNPIYPVPTEEESSAVGPGLFLNEGLHLMDLLVGFGGLKKTDTVLDVGCGLGRVAFPLAYYLSPSSRYEGIDLNEKLTTKANTFVNQHFPNFHFTHIDVFNGLYNSNGTLLSTEFSFPFEDALFDFSFLTSVFTHMFPDDVNHYLDEISRLLKPNGTCVVTCFLLTEESRKNIELGKSTIPFKHLFQGCLLMEGVIPEWAVAYDEQDFLRFLSTHGFTIEKFYKGGWDGSEGDYAHYQDLFILKKAS